MVGSRHQISMEPLWIIVVIHLEKNWRYEKPDKNVYILVVLFDDSVDFIIYYSLSYEMRRKLRENIGYTDLIFTQTIQ